MKKSEAFKTAEAMRKAADNKTAEADRATYMQIEHAGRGENILYHVGSLISDCQTGKKLQVAAAKGHRSGAWRCYVTGLCALVQRRVGDLKFEYIAQRL